MIIAETPQTVQVDLPNGRVSHVGLWAQWEEDSKGNILIIGFQPMSDPHPQIWSLALQKAEEFRIRWEREIQEDVLEWRLRVYV